MNSSIKTLAIIALSFAAAAVQVAGHAQATPIKVDTNTLISACEKNAGAFNTDEKAACIQVAREGEVKASTWVHPVVAQINVCKALAGATNPDEKAGCISAAVEQQTAFCAVAGGSAMSVERDACIRLVVEGALQGIAAL